MDEGTPKRISSARLAALSICAFWSSACETPSLAPAVGHFQSVAGGFTCELPGPGWQRRLNYPDLYLSVRHDDADNSLKPDIDVREDKGRSLEELEALRVRAIKSFEGDATFKAMPIRSIKIDGRMGWIEDQASMNALPATMHRKIGDPVYKPVLYRETTIYITGPKKSYAIKYSSPASLYDKHRPAFDRLLSSFKFAE